MATSKPALTPIISPDAQSDLKAVYVYNADHWGPTREDQYESFLLTGIAKLVTNHSDGRVVHGFPHLRRVTFRRKSQGHGHGHVVIYRVDMTEMAIRILHIYHTRQDILGRLQDQIDEEID